MVIFHSYVSLPEGIPGIVKGLIIIDRCITGSLSWNIPWFLWCRNPAPAAISCENYETLFLVCDNNISGWWFGTWMLFFYILGIVTPTDELIFLRGVGFNHQPDMITGFCPSNIHLPAGFCHPMIWPGSARPFTCRGGIFLEHETWWFNHQQ